MVTLNIDQDKLTGAKRPAGIYLIAVGVLVALNFILNPFYPDGFDAMIVWHVLDVMMFLGLGLALLFNYLYKRDSTVGDSTTAITRQYLESNLAFFVTAGLTIWFLFNWFSLLAHGNSYLVGNAPAWNIWNMIDLVLPITFGITGCRLIREGS